MLLSMKYLRATSFGGKDASGLEKVLEECRKVLS